MRGDKHELFNSVSYWCSNNFNNITICKGDVNRKNEPYRIFIDKGLFEIKESKYIVDNEVRIKPTT